MTTTIEVTSEQAKLLARYQRSLAYQRRYSQRLDVKTRVQETHRRRKADVKAGRRTPSHQSIVPNVAFDRLLGTLSRETLQRIAGFLEGDGSVNYYKNYKRPEVTFNNQDRPSLWYVKDVLQLSSKIGGPDRRGGYMLVISRQELIQSLLRALSPYLCCPVFVERVRKVFDECSYSIDFDLSEHEPTIPWFVGFGFDAESTKMDPRNQSLQTSQKDIRPLEKLQKLFNSGTIGKSTGPWGTINYIRWTGGSLRELIPYILKYSQHQERRYRLVAFIVFLAKEAPNGVWGKFYQQLKRDGLL